MTYSKKWESILPRFSLDRRITVLVLFATAIVMGAVATFNIPLELIPQGFTAPFLSVDAPWRDAPPQEVLDKLIVPLEEELSTVAGISNIESLSTRGYGRVFMQFKHGTDMDVAYREVRDRIERARAQMPSDIDQIPIRKHDAAGIPVYVLGLAVDEAVTDSYNLIQNEVVLPLSRIDGVASVSADGLEEKEILIELDRERTEAAGLNIYQLAQDLGDDNFTMASGTVHDSGRKLNLRSVAGYADLEALESRKVGPNTRLGDVATVTYEEPTKNYRVRAMSKPAVALVVMKEGQANMLEVAREVQAVVDRLEAQPHLRLIEMVALFDQGQVILESLGTLLDSGKIGAGFAVLVLFFFLRRFRMTLIITLSIPLSIVIALTVMYFVGETLNILTLLGLMISVGLLVDNSVVVAENIFRLHKEGLDRRQACVRGAGEIALAVIMATLTTIVVFLPVSLVEGQGQFFLLRMSIPISVSLLASLFVALVFVPLSVYVTLPQRASNGHKPSLVTVVHQRVNDVLRHAYDASFGRLNHGYTKVLGFFLGRRLDMVLVLLVVFAITGGIAGKEVQFVEVQEEERSGFEIDVELPASTTIEEAEEYFLEAEKLVEGMRDELDLAGWFVFHRTTWGEVQGWFNSPRTNDISPQEVTRRVVEALPEKAGVKLYTGEESENETKENKLVKRYTLFGEDPELLENVSEDLEEFLAGVDGVLGVKKAANQQPNEVGLVIDRERAQSQGVSPRTIAGVVGYSLRGQALPRYQRDGREIPVRVRFREEDREDLTQLADFGVPTMSGEIVALSSVTDVTFLPSQKRIWRDNKRIAYGISLDLEEGREEETGRRLDLLMAGIDLPEGITLGAPSRSSSNDDLKNMAFAGVVSVIFIYLLMGFLFESFILPLSIILTIPLASIGVVWIHFFTGLDIDFLGVVGIILLIGVVVNNGIVLIDYVNRLREEGHVRREAILMAAERRFRPIMMTALTTICGLVPITLAGTTSIGMSYTSFGLTLIGGLTTATLLTLLVIPIFYSLFDDLRMIFIGAIRRARGLESAPVS